MSLIQFILKKQLFFICREIKNIYNLKIKLYQTCDSCVGLVEVNQKFFSIFFSEKLNINFNGSITI